VTRQDKTTAIYVRSAVHSRPTDQSLAAQERACRSYASALGWRVGEVFADRGIASTRRDRPGMSRLLAAVRDGAIEHVLVARPDCLSRSHADIKSILHEMEARSVECVSVEQPTYLRAPEATDQIGTTKQPS
jgi:DNA invertase Pin-like site-specific DNA recombinase